MIFAETISGTDILYAPISEGAPSTRRGRERQTVDAIVSHYAGDEAMLSHDANGAPMLDGYNVSVSHSRLLAVVAFDRQCVIGVDAEEWRQALHQVRSRFLSPAEMLWCTSDEMLLRAWTIKEAVYKAAGIPHLQLTDIAIAADMSAATAADRIYDLHTLHASGTVITLARRR